MPSSSLETYFEVVLPLERLNDDKLTDEEVAEFTKKFLIRMTNLQGFEVREVAK